MRLPLLLALVGAALVLAACAGEAGEAGGDDGRPRVVASTALIAEFAARIAGDDAEVSVVIPAGVDLHSYEPPVEVARRIAAADLLLVNGYNLEEGVLSVIVENRGAGVPVVAVARGLTPLAGGHGHGHGHDEHDDDDHDDAEDHDDHDDEHAEEIDPLLRAEGDPHFWLDVSNAVRYVENIRAALIALDPERAESYEERAAALIAELRDLDGEVRQELERVPPERRKIVVFHDGYSYLAQAYGFELAAAVLPVAAGAQPSAREVVEVIEVVRRDQIPAVFREPEFDARVIETIAAETGARVLTLYSTHAEGVETYEEMMRANVRALVEGLGGG
jgi:ABC-type Zn uptake system ZnuABC Zn-binding protein ZnuA